MIVTFHTADGIARFDAASLMLAPAPPHAVALISGDTIVARFDANERAWLLPNGTVAGAVEIESEPEPKGP